MVNFKDWSEGWIKEGHNISFSFDGVTYYERVIKRDFAHYEYDWPETVDATTLSGPQQPEYIEVTRGFDEHTGLNHIWQLIFGIKGQAYIYVQLPTDLKRHGLPKLAWPQSDIQYTVAHFTEHMSPFSEPSFLPEHFMKRPEAYLIDFSAYNPNSIDLTDLSLNIMINKMVTERIGTESYGETGLKLTETKSRFKTLLDNLYKRQVACRPISVLPVRAPAVAPAGE